tara:strand:+ start:512 stop:811 length:300 start_codon:yes stop_codon:yes gene_type:complete
MSSFICSGKSANGKPCAGHTHVLQETDVTDRPNNNRCEFCSVHCEKLKQFRIAKKRTRALFYIINEWPNLQFSHIDYTQYIKATDILIEELLQVKEELE